MGMSRGAGIRALARVTLLVAATSIACEDTSGPNNVDMHGLSKYDPPLVYLEWWKDIEECSGVEGDFSRVEWFLADSLVVEGDFALGLWVSPHDIYLIRTVTSTSWVVKHEMLHDLLKMKGRAHDSTLFDECASRDRL